MEKQEQPSFIRCANGLYPILIDSNPAASWKDPRLVERLVRLKTGTKELEYDEFGRRLKDLLNEIIESKSLYESENLRYFTELRKRVDYIVENGRLREAWGDYKVYPVGLAPVIITLVNFLSDSKDFKRLRKCLLCDDFFVAGSLSREVLCTKDTCKKSYDKYRKRWQRETQPAVYDAVKNDEFDPVYERLRRYWKTKPFKKRKKRKDVP